MNRRALFAMIAICSPALPLSASCQGTQADYDRANSLYRRTEGTVYGASVKPHWLKGGDRFWYRKDLPQGQREFWLVDAVRTTRRPAFDHARVATALSQALGQPQEAHHLPIDELEFNAGTIRLVVGEKAFTLDPRNSSLIAQADPADPLQPLSSWTGSGVSRNGGDQTLLTFVNRTGKEIELFWLDTGGERHPYGKILPGERATQHTYAGHLWLITFQDGAPLGTMEAPDTPTVAVIERPAPVFPPQPGQDPFLSPDGRRQVIFRDHNVILREVSSNQETKLTQDGSSADSYEGAPCWSPDSRKLILLKVVPAQEHKIYVVESSPSDQLQPKLHSYDYLKPGDKIEHPRPHLFDVASHAEVPIQDTLFSTPWSLDEFRWDTGSRHFTFLYNQRGHQVMRLLEVDAQTGAVRSVIDEESKTFIDYTNKVFLSLLPDQRAAIWMSERSGWCHLYRVDTASGRVQNPITQGEWVVRGVDRIDEAKRQIWFRASGIVPGQDPYYIHYARVNFDGTGLTLLTEGDGTHTIATSPDGRYLIDTYSRVDLPPITSLRSTLDGRKVIDLERAEASELIATGVPFPERFVAKARDGKTDIYGVIFRPSNFDAAKKYPIVEQIYAGPHSSYVPKSFSAAHGAQETAELGFIVVQIDGMGTSNRSKAFQDVCWKNLADAGLPDRILWIKAAAATRPFMDLTRVGIYGGSAGGQSALGALLLHGDFYKVGVADCGCHDNRMDKIWWNEQWMGWPIGPHYAEQSNVTLAPRLQGKLLLLVGEMDTNVDPASTMQVVNALVKADKDFEMLVIPGAGHGSAGTPYGRRKQQDFLVRHLLSVAPRGKTE